MISGGDRVTGTSKYPVETVYVPPGTFQMGYDKCYHYSDSHKSDQCPPHTVTLTHGTHWMTTEFTNGHMEELKKRQPGKFDHYKKWCDLEPAGWWNWIKRKLGFETRTYMCERPLTGVSWSQANSICSELGMRLPTEAEFEYAAKGKSGKDEFATATGEMNSGKHFRDLCRHGVSGGDVKEYPPNSYGLYGLCGNVFKWVSDWYGTYSSDAVTDPQGPMSGTYKVLRGAEGMQDFDGPLHSAYRIFVLPDLPAPYYHFNYHYRNVGFRCVATQK